MDNCKQSSLTKTSAWGLASLRELEETRKATVEKTEKEMVEASQKKGLCSVREDRVLELPEVSDQCEVQETDTIDGPPCF